MVSLKQFLVALVSLFLVYGSLHAQLAWPYIESRLEEVNAKYPHSKLDVKNIPDATKSILMMKTSEEFEIWLADVNFQQQLDNERVMERHVVQREKAEHFEQFVRPLLAQAKTPEAFHRLVLFNRQYCSAKMVAEAESWLAENADPKE